MWSGHIHHLPLVISAPAKGSLLPQGKEGNMSSAGLFRRPKGKGGTRGGHMITDGLASHVEADHIVRENVKLVEQRRRQLQQVLYSLAAVWYPPCLTKHKPLSARR